MKRGNSGAAQLVGDADPVIKSTVTTVILFSSINNCCATKHRQHVNSATATKVKEHSSICIYNLDTLSRGFSFSIEGQKINYF